MKKTPLALLPIVIVLAVAYFLIWPSVSKAPASSAVADYKNGTYTIDENPVTLQNGLRESEVAPGSVSKIITRYFGNEVRGDFDSNGTEDVAFLITQTGGGSGTFYYAAAALKVGGGYVGTNAVLLGDRIAPQTTEWREPLIVVNYATRKEGEPVTARPSVGVSEYLKIIDDVLIRVEPE